MKSVAKNSLEVMCSNKVGNLAKFPRNWVSVSGNFQTSLEKQVI